jgi:hypothetical protein
LNNTQNILDQFEPISLSEMDGVKLMSRTDTKFLFTVDQFESIMQKVKDQYRILEVNGKRINRYRTLYYDTSDLDLYNQHHNGKLNRYKVRHRTYVESETGFLEVKFKNNKGRTIKKRITEQTPPEVWDGEDAVFLTKALPFSPEALIPTMWVNYSRCTFVHNATPERVTVDLDLEFVKNETVVKMIGLAIAEVKQEKRGSSLFLKMMKKYHIREGSISKYCLGIALTDESVKKNNFKRKLMALKHLVNYDTSANS